MKLQFVKKVMIVMGSLSMLLGLVGCDQQCIAVLEKGVANDADARELWRA